MIDPATDEPAALFLAEVARLCEAEPELAPLSGGILAGVSLDIAHDSRSFARLLGIEHALVLRELEQLFAQGRLTVTRRDERTRRTHYAPAPATATA